jgi:hypothetical protein
MRTLQLIAALAGILVMAVPATAGTPNGNIAAAASSSPAFKTLAAAIKAAKLTSTLASKGPFTVFAPTNDAFAKLPAGTVENLLKPENRDQLAKVLNQHVFSAKDTPLKDLSITTEGELLKIKGKLHSKGDVPFETNGSLSATPDGKVRVRAQKIKAAHLPVKGLMDLLGLKIEKLLNTEKVRGVRVEGDDLILDPEQLFPPPRIKGKLSDIKIQGNQLLMIFGTGRSASGLYRGGGNYMAFRGGLLRFGKLTMNDSDMVLIDADPKDPFDFFLDHYKEQLVAGCPSPATRATSPSSPT